jgi:hypothetical protein
MSAGVQVEVTWAWFASVVRTIRWVASFGVFLAAASAVAGLLNLLVIVIVICEVRAAIVVVFRSLSRRSAGVAGWSAPTRLATYRAYLLAPVS